MNRSPRTQPSSTTSRIGVPCERTTPRRSAAVSAWASKWMTPTAPFPRCSATAAMFGWAIEWSPPSTIGTAPAAQISLTRRRTCGVALGRVPRHRLGVAVVDHAEVGERVDAEPHVRPRRRHAGRVVGRADGAWPVAGCRAGSTPSRRSAPRGSPRRRPPGQPGRARAAASRRSGCRRRTARGGGWPACSPLVEQSGVVGDDAVAAERAHPLDIGARVHGPGEHPATAPVHGGDGLGRDDVMPEGGVAGAGPGMDVGGCGPAPRHPEPARCDRCARPRVLVERGERAQLAGREDAPVCEACDLARGKRLALVAGSLQVDQEAELGRGDLRELGEELGQGWDRGGRRRGRRRARATRRTRPCPRPRRSRRASRRGCSRARGRLRRGGRCAAWAPKLPPTLGSLGAVSSAGRAGDF